MMQPAIKVKDEPPNLIIPVLKCHTVLIIANNCSY